MIPLVLIPGFMLNERVFSKVDAQLSQTYDLVHPRIYRGGSIESMASSILESTPPHFNLIGFSMGGFIAREMVRRAPSRVEKLILIATSSRGDTVERRAVKEKALKLAENFNGVSRTSIRRSLSNAKKADDELVDFIRNMSVELGADVFKDQVSMRRDSDTHRLGEIKCETLIVCGEQDQLRTIEESAELKENIPNSCLCLMNTGHMIPLEAPDALAEAIDRFLR